MDILPAVLALSIASTTIYAAEQEAQSLDTEVSNSEISAPSACISTKDNEIDKIKAKYESLMTTEKEKVVQEVSAIKSDTPNPNEAEAVIRATFHFRDEKMEIKLDLPSVTMVDQKMAMDIPEVTMRTQAWSWDSPEATMKRQCTPGIPETVIGSGTCDAFGIKYSCPTITVRQGQDICIDVPEFRMARQEAKLDIPELTMKRQDWVMGVPEVKMETQRIVFNYPALVVDSIDAKNSDLEKRGVDLSKRSMDTFNGISTAMKSEVTLASMKTVDKSFACQKKQLSVQIRAAYNDLNAMQEASKASIDRATSLKASSEIINALSSSSNKLLEGKKTLLNQYVAARREIETKRKEILTKMNDSLNSNPAQGIAATIE